jgi:hemolysin activation/secretion protein
MAASAIGIAFPAFSQAVRPDAGTVLEPSRQIPALPAPGGAPIVVPPAPPAAPFDRSVAVTPAGFRIQGNTLVSEAELQQAVAPFVNRRTDMAGLLEAAAAVRKVYRDRGYILTEAYLPQQQFAASGGTVAIQVLEARIGKVSSRVEGQGPSPALVQAIVHANLRSGDAVTEAGLERPILLLRDLRGFDATAEVLPGANPGEADIVVMVKPAGKPYGALLGADNHGPRPAGQVRAYAELEGNNLAGHGDILSGRVQLSDDSGNRLYRLGYSAALGGHATRLGIQLARAEYALGRQFAALGATGDAQVIGISATHPFIRTRKQNLIGSVAFERKDLDDRITTPAFASDRRVDALRFSALGNFVDDWTGNAFTSYAVSLTHGRLRLDPGSFALDQGVGGLRTAGTFQKLNVELQRATWFSVRDRITVGLQGQAASKNLTSAEQFSLGGPNGVRGYPVSEGIGDSGVLATVEYRHQFDAIAGVPLGAGVFYDWGRVKFNEGGAPFPGPDSQVLSSAGVGLTAGTPGNYLLSLQVAWRTRSVQPASDPDRRPRVWLSLQKWL